MVGVAISGFRPWVGSSEIRLNQPLLLSYRLKINVVNLDSKINISVSMPNTQRYLSADEVVAALAISKGTLYSYVSRGLIRSIETEGKSRARRYLAADVERLEQRKAQRRDPTQAAATALHFGDPVLASAITLIADGDYYYRGQRVLDLIELYGFEAVTTLLWTGTLAVTPPWPAGGVSLSPAVVTIATQQLRANNPAVAFQLALLSGATADLAAYNQQPPMVAQTGRRILDLMVQLLENDPHPMQTGQPTVASSASIATRLQRCWLPDQPAHAAVLDQALILCADHEFNVSSFTARCVASAGSTPYAAVVAALSALQGYRHGGVTARVMAFLRAATVDPQQTVIEYLRRGESLPGLGHRLYPQGDPRWRALLALAEQAAPTAPILPVVQALLAAATQAGQEPPNLDLGLAMLAVALALPSYAPFALFALGRTAGWIGHIIEQYETGELIRPRAHYQGVQPGAVLLGK